MQLLPNLIAAPFALQRLSNLEIGRHGRKLGCETHVSMSTIKGKVVSRDATTPKALAT